MNLKKYIYEKLYVFLSRIFQQRNSQIMYNNALFITQIHIQVKKGKLLKNKFNGFQSTFIKNIKPFFFTKVLLCVCVIKYILTSVITILTIFFQIILQHSLRTRAIKISLQKINNPQIFFSSNYTVSLLFIY